MDNYVFLVIRIDEEAVKTLRPVSQFVLASSLADKDIEKYDQHWKGSDGWVEMPEPIDELLPRHHPSDQFWLREVDDAPEGATYFMAKKLIWTAPLIVEEAQSKNKVFVHYMNDLANPLCGIRGAAVSVPTQEKVDCTDCLRILANQ